MQGARWIALLVFVGSLGAACTATAAPQSGNHAAPLYQQAADLLAGVNDDGPAAPLLDSESVSQLFFVRSRGDLSDQVRADLARIRPVLDLAYAAAACRTHSARLRPRSSYFDRPADSFFGTMNLARLMTADAVIRSLDGDGVGAARAAGAVLATARHVSSDSTLNGTLVGAAVGGLAVSRIRDGIEAGIFDRDAAQTLLDSARLPAVDTFGAGPAIQSEWSLLRVEMVRQLDEPTMDNEDFFGRLTMGDVDECPFDGRPREAILRELDEIGEIHASFASAMQEPDPRVRATRLDALEARIDAGAGGQLGELVLMHFPTLRNTLSRVEGDLGSIQSDLRAIASGEATPMSRMNAAVLLRAAADSAIRTDGDDQVLLETVRVAFGASDASMRGNARVAIDSQRANTLEPIIRASTYGRCDFHRETRLNRFATPGIAPFGPGVRGALRLLVVDALLAKGATAAPADPQDTLPALTSSGDAADSESDAATAGPLTLPDALAVAIRVAALVASDSSLAHAALANAIVADVLLVAREHLAPGSSVEQLVSLATAVEQLDRADLLGHRRGLEMDRQTFVASYHTARPMRELQARRLERLDADGLATVLISLQSAPCELVDRGPLLALTDVVDAVECVAVDEIREQLNESPLLDRTRSRRNDDPLGGVVLPTPVRANELARDAERLVDDLDRLLRDVRRAVPAD